MIDHSSADALILFGITGDLARRKLVPALARLFADRAGPEALQVVGVSRSDLGDDGFRERLAHAGDGLTISYTDVEVEQEPGRPYVYLARVLGPTKGMDIVSIEDPANPELLYQWRIEDPELHIGLGGMDTKYFKHDGRYYVIQSLQFFGGPDSDLGAVVLDVTGLPDASTVKEVGRIRAPDTPTGFHNIWAYKHSSGKPILVATTSGPHANLYDLEAFLEG